MSTTVARSLFATPTHERGRALFKGSDSGFVSSFVEIFLTIFQDSDILAVALASPNMEHLRGKMQASRGSLSLDSSPSKERALAQFQETQRSLTSLSGSTQKYIRDLVSERLDQWVVSYS
jgi:hypothetical protein